MFSNFKQYIINNRSVCLLYLYIEIIEDCYEFFFCDHFINTFCFASLFLSVRKIINKVCNNMNIIWILYVNMYRLCTLLEDSHYKSSNLFFLIMITFIFHHITTNMQYVETMKISCSCAKIIASH